MRNMGVVLMVVFVSVLLLAGCGKGGGGGGAVSWAKTYGGADFDRARSVQQTTDGGYVVAGDTFSFGTGDDDFWVLKLNSAGTPDWQKRYGGAENEQVFSIQQTSDGGYIVAGYTASFGDVTGDIWVLKLHADGTPDWQRTYGGVFSDYANSIQQTSDDGYIVAGYTQSFGAGDYDFWVLKLNSDGTVDWENTYGGADSDSANSIQQTSDGGYIVAGYTESFGTGGDFWVLKLDSVGTVEWQKTYGGSEYDRAMSVQQTSDGCYVVAGETLPFGASYYDLWVLKLDSAGAVSWQKTYGGTNSGIAYSIQQTSDGGYIVAGETYSFGAGVNDFWVLKLDSAGEVSWQKRYGGADKERAYSIQQTSGGYIVAGITYSFGAGDCDSWVLKLRSNGTIAFNPASGAQMVDTDAVVTDTSASVDNTSVSAEPTSATVTDTTADVADTNATVVQQAP